MDVEAAGALATAGLIAHEIEAESKLEGDRGHACANCHTALNGDFCHHCGQSAHIHHSLSHLVEEVLHGIWHFDAKGWRTIPVLLLKPGQLTRRYIDGQRMRYLSPLALFLFMIFFMFFVFSWTNNGELIGITQEANISTMDRIEIEKEREQKKAKVSSIEAALKNKEGDWDKSDLIEAKVELKIVEKILAIFEAGTLEKDTSAQASMGAKMNDKKTYTSVQLIDLAIYHATQNPDLAIYKIKNTAYKFSFMLLPITLPFIWLMFAWRRGVAMYDHAIFSLYSMSFMSLLFSLLAILARLDLGELAVALFLCVPPVHMFNQLRGTYQLSNGSAAWRTMALLGVTSTAFVLFILFVLLMGLK
ncbi:DUF3667 domain-containing protein [Iodobacter fluviatilis]|uniref:Protein of uncharacterized function (DUF3667) n=1 Tax=Iodobacter fluviatilis TaxID=537 RepID=A0A377Q2G7_9NEIS|nr:DUF3667 domain-containing protein [Iodobacter fluviatilis]TCU90429.1 uncharacterized protein DUF3667 [Iodobacter fluviatilis]STQ89456.1 Protein of uncharacterised function (DUF3667) [Iodobacter fluviatilis]